MSPVASTRWCPTPEQVMILEEMYRGGVRTPNAAQIQQITAHLSLYGKIEGKNVFYWFQNHKARDRQKLRKRLLIGKQLQQLQQHQQQQQQKQQQQQQQDQMGMGFNHHVVPPIPSKIHEHFQPPHFLQQLHFDHQPPTPRYAYPPSSHVAFHHLPHPPAFASPQARAEDVTPAGMGHRYAWKYGREKASSCRQVMAKTTDNDWTMSMFRDHDDDDDHDHDHDHDHDVGSTTTTRPLKTLQLFPINDKISLKEHQFSSLEASNF